MEKSAVTALANANNAGGPQSGLARFQPQELWPRSWGETKELATYLSKSTLLPKHLQPYKDEQGKSQTRESDVFLIILSGLELGVAPLVACREMYIVDGKVSSSSLLKVGLVRTSGECLTWQEIKSTNEEAIYSTKRRGDSKDTVRSFSFKDAERAGLTGKDNWRKFPAAMLRRRCQGQLADDVYPDIVKGLGSADEEAQIEGEVRWAERVGPPPSPVVALVSSNAGAAPVAPVETVDAKTGEVSGPAFTEFERLKADMEAVDNLDGLAECSSAVKASFEKRLISEEERKSLLEVYKTRKQQLGGNGSNGNGH